MDNAYGSDWVMSTGVAEAKARLREKAQNEFTCAALNDMLKAEQLANKNLREEVKRLNAIISRLSVEWQDAVEM